MVNLIVHGKGLMQSVAELAMACYVQRRRLPQSPSGTHRSQAPALTRFVLRNIRVRQRRSLGRACASLPLKLGLSVQRRAGADTWAHAWHGCAHAHVRDVG